MAFPLQASIRGAKNIRGILTRVRCPSELPSPKKIVYFYLPTLVISANFRHFEMTLILSDLINPHLSLDVKPFLMTPVYRVLVLRLLQICGCGHQLEADCRAKTDGARTQVNLHNSQ